MNCFVEWLSHRGAPISYLKIRRTQFLVLLCVICSCSNHWFFIRNSKTLVSGSALIFSWFPASKSSCAIPCNNTKYRNYCNIAENLLPSLLLYNAPCYEQVGRWEHAIIKPVMKSTSSCKSKQSQQQIRLCKEKWLWSWSKSFSTLRNKNNSNFLLLGFPTEVFLSFFLLFWLIL